MATLSQIINGGTNPPNPVLLKNSVVGLEDNAIPTFQGLTVNNISNIISSNTGFFDITSSLNIKTTSPNNPTWANFRDGIWAWRMSATTMNELWIEFHPNHDYNPSTGFYPHVHFATATTTASGVVRFGFEYTCAKGYNQGASSIFGATNTVYLEYTFTTNRQYEHLILEYPTPIIDAKLETDSLMLCRIFRDAANVNDTYADPVFLLTTDLHCQADHLYTPNKNFPFS